MSLAREIESIRDSAFQSLDDAHNYYFHSKTAWRVVQHLANRGTDLSVTNRSTGLTLNGQQLAHKGQSYVTDYLAKSTLQDFVAIFEQFLFEFLTQWLSAYPQMLAKKELSFELVLNSVDRQAIIKSVVEKHLLELAYSRLPKWFSYMEDRVKLGCPSSDEIERLSEIKATRDVFVHAGGIANEVYVDKSMGRARVASGEQLTIPDTYHRESWELIRKVVTKISGRAIAKTSPTTSTT